MVKSNGSHGVKSAMSAGGTSRDAEREGGLRRGKRRAERIEKLMPASTRLHGGGDDCWHDWACVSSQTPEIRPRRIQTEGRFECLHSLECLHSELKLAWVAVLLLAPM